MNKEQVEIVVGGLLHDIGKVLYRGYDGCNHSQSGYDFLKNEVEIDSKNILEQVHFHHKKLLSQSNVGNKSLAYITYIADNIAASADGRQKDDGEIIFQKDILLSSVFNILNGNKQSLYYEPKTLDIREGINYPTDEKIQFSESFYNELISKIKDSLKNIEWTKEYINSLLEILEGYLSFIPSSTSKKELADIALYDHVKITAAVGSCIYEYLNAVHCEDYKKELMDNENEFYSKEAFLFLSCDVSGIQSFIYNLHSNEDVLKSLRSRSFYLEIMVENMIDELLDRTNMSRANLVYSGGGHCYLLLPNTPFVEECIRCFEKEFNQWLLEHFKTDLYVGFGYTKCAAEQLIGKNTKNVERKNIYAEVSRALSDKKNCRYSAEDIIKLNNNSSGKSERECKICHRTYDLKDDKCDFCKNLLYISSSIINEKFFKVTKSKEDKSLMIGPERYLYSVKEGDLKNIDLRERDDILRIYGKNKMVSGKNLATKLWIGDYCSSKYLDELVKNGSGIDRLGVLRADIDNLGQTFISGFDGEFNTISRTATLSRKLSIFFKHYINYILENPQFSIDGKLSKRNVTIIYSGGDDVFVVGNWKDVIEFAVDLKDCFTRFTQNTLTISTGIGLFKHGYPISYMAAKTGKLEECAKENKKENKEKDSIALFSKEYTFFWTEFIERVIEEKFKTVYGYFWNTEEHGKAFMYHLLNLLRERYDGSEREGDSINLARMAYTLARLEPEKKSDEEEKSRYRNFSTNMYFWMKNKSDCLEAQMAIYLYAYLIRKEEQNDNN